MKMSITNSFLKVISNNSKCLKSKIYSLHLIAKCSTSTHYKYEEDPGPKFSNSEIQKLLKSITRMEIDKVFRKRSVPDNHIEYKFMTTEQLEKKFKEIAEKAEEYLQMPPIVMIKDDTQKIISKDPALQGFSNTKYVIADITFGLKQSKRKVIIRQLDGTLEYAPMDISKRVNQIYAPLPGRKIRTPRMFESENLQRCLDEHQYEFILDRMCIQYEPYEKDFHDISNKVYCHINDTKSFDDLRSTRHFGPMAFFLAWHNKIDDLLYDMIKRDYLRNAVELISILYQLKNIDYDKGIHERLSKIPKMENIFGDLKKPITSAASDDIHEQIKSAIGKTRADFEADEVCLEFVEDFVKNKALKKVQLELAVHTFREANDEKKKLYEGLRKAHGVN